MGQLLQEVMASVTSGYNGSRDPALQVDQGYCGGVNLSIRGGFARTRPALVEQGIAGMPAGLFQGAGVWSLENGDRFVFVVDGRVFVLVLDTLALSQIGSVALLSTTAQCFFCQADRYLVVQDGESEPVILLYDAGTPRRFDYYTDAAYGSPAPTPPDVELAASTYASTWTLQDQAQLAPSIDAYTVGLRYTGPTLDSGIHLASALPATKLRIEYRAYPATAPNVNELTVIYGTTVGIPVAQDDYPISNTADPDNSWSTIDIDLDPPLAAGDWITIRGPGPSYSVPSPDAPVFVRTISFLTYESGGPAPVFDFDDSQKVPVGTVMSYVMGRLHVVPRYVPGTTESGKPYFLSGDIVKPYTPEDVLRFSETQYLTGGGAHGMPLEMGDIGGMAMVRNSQQGTGVGDLYVIGSNGMAAFAVSVPRSQWTDVTISQGLFVGSGSKSPWAVLAVNSDLIYRATDGIRMLSYTTSQQWQGGSLMNSPISTEVAPYMTDPSYLRYVSGAYFDNNVLFTCEGTGSRYFRGMVHMDWAPLISFGQAATAPAYTGIWTGANFAQLITARKAGYQTCFVFAQGPKLYLVDPDVDADNGAVDIESRIITRTFNFKDFSLRKKLYNVDLWISKLTRDTTVTVYARPNGYPFWAMLSSKLIRVGAGGSPQMRHRVRFGLDDILDKCDATNGRPLYNCAEFQFAIEWTGHMQLDKALFTTELLGEQPPDPCGESVAVSLVETATSGVALDDFSYTIE